MTAIEEDVNKHLHLTEIQSLTFEDLLMMRSKRSVCIL